MYRIWFLMIVALFSLQGKGQPGGVSDLTAAAIAVAPATALRLDAVVNSKFDETAPLISPDGRSLYFIRRSHPQNVGTENQDDIWISLRQSDGSWGRGVNLGAPLNNRFANAVVAVDPGGDLLYLADNYRFGNNEGVAMSRQEGRLWSVPEPLPIGDFYNLSPGYSFHMDPLGSTLVMSVQRDDSVGDRDLYVSFRKNDGHWSSPLHLGNTINTPGLETGVFLAADGKTLYFASNGHGGLGGLDLFVSRRLDNSWTSWSRPQNLGPGINTVVDDLSISLPASGESAFVTYPDTSGTRSIYRVNLPEPLRPAPVTLVKGQLKGPGPGQASSLSWQDLGNPQETHPLPLGEDGTFTVIVPPGREVGIFAGAEGFFPAGLRPGASEQPEEVDIDQGMFLASTSLNPEYQQRDREIEHLRLRLDRLDEEMLVLQAQREAYQAALKEENLAGKLEVPRYSDPELDALRHRYQLYLQQKGDTLPPVRPDWQIRSVEEPRPAEYDVRPAEARDKELAEMKQRFRRHYGISGEAPQDSSTPQEAFLWEEARGFEDFRESVRRELIGVLAPEVSHALAGELSGEVRAEIEPTLDPRLAEQLRAREADIRNHIQSSFSAGAMIQQAAEPTSAGPAWQRELEGELRQAMADEVRLELRQTLREDIRRALRNEMLLQIKQDEADILRRQLDAKILQQVQEEEKQGKSLPALPPDVSIKGGAGSPAIYRETSQVLVLTPVEKGSIILLNNVAFNPNTATFKGASYAELDRVADYLAAHPRLMVEIAVHTNGLLGHSTALQLSGQRAKVIADYLAGKGIARKRIANKGYGKTEPIASNDTLEGRRKNQRIEMRVLQVD